MTQPDELLLEPIQLDPDLWPEPREYPGDDSPDVGHGTAGETAVGEPAGFEGAEDQWVVIATKDYSSRGRKNIVAGIFHTAEGARTVTELGNFFRTTPRYVSSHVGHDTAGRRGRYVPDRFAAWTNPDINEQTLTNEQCAFARWTEEQWLAEKLLLEADAQWVAAVHKEHGIPIRWITPAQLNRAIAANDPKLGGFGDHYTVTVARKRVGGHTDCGPGFQRLVKDRILARARIIANPPKPTTVTGGSLMALSDQELTTLRNQTASTWNQVGGSGTDDKRPLVVRVNSIEAKLDQLIAALTPTTPENGAPQS